MAVRGPEHGPRGKEAVRIKVAVLTMFNGLSGTYSLVNVVAEQLRMLLDAGVSVRVLVSQDCPDGERRGVFADERLEWVKITNRLDGAPIVWHDYSMPDGEVHDGFFRQADAVAADFVSALRDADVCILHDILYQGWHLLHNVALRKAQAELPGLRFLAFTHSAPVNPPAKLVYPFSCRYTPVPNTVYVYPTASGLPALARQYGVPEGRCRTVANCLDPLLALGPDVRALQARTDLLSPEYLLVCPGRFSTGKQFEKAAALAGALRRRTERSVKIVFCDFPCMDTDAARYKLAVRAAGLLCGLESEDLVFTSDLGYPDGFPREGVLDLFTLSNLFVCPSSSESFGLTALEAASRGNFLVLNGAVPALEELGKTLGAYFMRWNARNFGFDTKETYRPSERAYLEEHALRIADAMRGDPVLRSKTLARLRFSPQWVFRNQLQPLLEP